MGALLLGGGALLLLLLLLWGFVGADTKLLARKLRHSAAAVLLIAALGLAALDRVGLATLAASLAWGLFTGGHPWPQEWSFGRSMGQGSRNQQPSRMSRAEALRVLDLDEGATNDNIQAAHKRLMLKNHPDRGGSNYLAAKINEARDVLLGT